MNVASWSFSQLSGKIRREVGMSWSPVAHLHSIERVRLVCAFTQPIAPKVIRRIQSDFETIRESLGFDPISALASQVFSLQISPFGAPVFGQQVNGSEPPVAGWRASRLDNSNQQVESVQVENNTVIYETLEYTRWASFLVRAKSVFLPILDILSDLDDYQTMALEYYDRFVFEGDTESANPQGFVVGLSGHISEQALSDGELWHLHKGWFEGAKFGKLLINQNIDAIDVPFDASIVRRNINVLTKAEARKGFWQFDGAEIDDQLQLMHERTKAVFASALEDPMLEKVGIVMKDGGTK